MGKKKKNMYTRKCRWFNGVIIVLLAIDTYGTSSKSNFFKIPMKPGK